MRLDEPFMTTYRITGPYFVAGVVVDDGGIVLAAPILGRWHGQPWAKLKAYALSKGWSVEDRGEAAPLKP